MQDGADHEELAVRADDVEHHALQPAFQLVASIAALSLFVIFDVIADHQIRPELLVTHAAHGLPAAASNDFDAGARDELALSPLPIADQIAEVFPDALVALQLLADIVHVRRSDLIGFPNDDDEVP